MSTGEKKNKFYERSLPDEYREALVIDAADRKSGSKIGLISLVIAVVSLNIFFFLYALPRLGEIGDSFSVVGCVLFIPAYFIYVTLHELTHGFVYKLLTKQKLTFGFKPPAAYCGVPDIYVYRSTSLCSLFAPLVVFGALFTALFFIVSDPFFKLLILVLLALHLSGCAGDIYGIWLLLFKFKNPATLRKDTGPKLIYYTKDEMSAEGKGT